MIESVSGHVTGPEAPFNDNRLQRFETTDALYPFVCALLSQEGQKTSVKGTAFFIAPGLALTATHVLQDGLSGETVEAMRTALRGETSSARADSNKFEVDGRLFLFAQLPGGRYLSFDVQGASCFGFLDVSLLFVASNPACDWKAFGSFPVLRLEPPPVESVVRAVGYPCSASTHEDGHSDIQLWPRQAKGRVQEVHVAFRDPVFLNFPCFRVDALLMGGMSGSPVVDEAGNICGVVSSSYELGAGDEPIGYVASMWAVSALPLPAHVGQSDPERLGDLMASGAILTIGLDLVRGTPIDLGAHGFEVRLSLPPGSAMS